LNDPFSFLNKGLAMKWKIDDVPIFAAVVEKNGITAAAEHLGMPKSTVSTAIARLETGLGLRLIDRNSRNLRITGEGETFYRHAQRIVEQVTEANAMMAGHTAVPSGRLSVAVPPAFSQEIMARHLAGFRARWPAVELDLNITTHGLELIRDQVDVAVVVGPLEDSDYIARTLVSGRLLWVTSPAYLPRLDAEPQLESLSRHVQLCEKRYGLARVPVRIDGKAGHIDLLHGVSHVNDPLVVRRAVMAGAGVSVLPAHYCREQLRDGLLVEVFQPIEFDLAASKLTVIYPSRRLVSPRVRVFLEFLSEICAGI